MKSRGKIISIPQDARFLAVSVLVMGWSWCPSWPTGTILTKDHHYYYYS